jgi:sugar O-acyltransferase (sialic acid O-acetyltransferase NeuD family)
LFGRSQLKTCFKQGINKIIIGIGDNSHRKIITETAISLGFSLVSAIHPSSVIASDVDLGLGIVWKALVVIEPGAIIGENTTIGAQSYVGHGVKVGNLVHISGGVRVGGNTIIKNKVDIGIGAVIKNNILIGENSKVGAGTVVIENIPDNYVAFGVPARLLWERDTWD